jgi:HlyD family secretion protein
VWAPVLLVDGEPAAGGGGPARAGGGPAAAGVRAAWAAVVSARARVAEAEAGLGRAEGEHDRWKAQLARYGELVERRTISDKLVDETRDQFRAAQSALGEAAARIDSARSALEESEANAIKAEADETAAQARLRVARADLARTRVMLEYAEIRAPYPAVVTQRNVHTGHFVQPAGSDNARPLVVVARNDVMRIAIDVPEVEAPLVEPGDAATIRVQSLRGRRWEGTVARTSWALDPGNRTLRVEIDVENEDGGLRPGMYARANILLAERPDALVLPATALVRDGDLTFCCAVEEGRIVRRPIEIGLRTREEAEILSGLSGEETIVQVRADGLEPDQSVEVIEPAAN